MGEPSWKSRGRKAAIVGPLVDDLHLRNQATWNRTGHIHINAPSSFEASSMVLTGGVPGNPQTTGTTALRPVPRTHTDVRSALGHEVNGLNILPPVVRTGPCASMWKC